MIAGPSEILVVADGANDPAWIAADLLSQAEHDPLAQAILITDDGAFVRNWRIRDIEIIADDFPRLPSVAEIPNSNDQPIAVDTATVATHQIIIRVLSTWPAEPGTGEPFNQLVLQELEFWGTLADGTTPLPRALPTESDDPLPETDPYNTGVSIAKDEVALVTWAVNEGTCFGIARLSDGAIGRLKAGRCDSYESVNPFIQFLFIQPMDVDGKVQTVVAGFAEGVDSVEVTNEGPTEATQTVDNAIGRAASRERG